MNRWGPVVLRSAVGVVFVAHGLPKLIPIWGGSPAGTAAFFESIGLRPGYPLALGVGLVEALGGLALILGAGTLWVSLLLVIDMAVAIWKAQLPHGLFLNWTLQPGRGHGYEYNLVLIAALVCLALTGPGSVSLDEFRTRSRETHAARRARLRTQGMS